MSHNGEDCYHDTPHSDSLPRGNRFPGAIDFDFLATSSSSVDGHYDHDPATSDHRVVVDLNLMVDMYASGSNNDLQDGRVGAWPGTEVNSLTNSTLPDTYPYMHSNGCDERSVFGLHMTSPEREDLNSAADGALIHGSLGTGDEMLFSPNDVTISDTPFSPERDAGGSRTPTSVGWGFTTATLEDPSRSPIQTGFTQVYGSQSAKRVYSGKACDGCRRRKVKCEVSIAGSTSCDRCTAKRLTCTLPSTFIKQKNIPSECQSGDGASGGSTRHSSLLFQEPSTDGITNVGAKKRRSPRPRGYRKAREACAECKRRKTRCLGTDGRSVCDGCSRRGLTVDECTFEREAGPSEAMAETSALLEDVLQEELETDMSAVGQPGAFITWSISSPEIS